MNTYFCARMAGLLPLLMVMAAYTTTAGAEEFTGSKTIVGQANSLLVEGAAALKAGRVEEGIRLTLEGLKEAATAQDTAAGHSNACAGYVILKQWAEALAECNAALALDTSNWRTYNNRAAIYIEQGLYELGLQDLQAGLALAPEAPLLHESMRILERNRRLTGRQVRKALAS
jgi:tetratricopeptide (TPR) repeat protein